MKKAYGKLFFFQPEGAEGCKVSAYLQRSVSSSSLNRRRLPAIVICPGGSYQAISERESGPVAKEYFAEGYHVFVLDYSVNVDAADFVPLCQLASTIAHIRKYEQEWLVDGNKIAVCGFSAGGHLAASLGTLFNLV